VLVVIEILSLPLASVGIVVCWWWGRVVGLVWLSDWIRGLCIAFCVLVA
jgi:hypothetical protein